MLVLSRSMGEKKDSKAPHLKETKETSGIDLKKVNRIREAIKKGQYEIDFEKLAEKLLKDL